MVDIVPSKAMALDVVTASGTLTIVNVHSPGSGGDSWAPKASFWADVAMYTAANSAGGTRPVLIGGYSNVWLESPGHPTTKRFVALWKQCGFPRAGHSVEEDRKPTRDGHKLDSWAMQERPYLAPGRPPTALGSNHGPVVQGILLAVGAKERIMRLAYSHARGRLHTIRSDSPGCGRRRRTCCSGPVTIRHSGRGSHRTEMRPPWTRRQYRPSSTCSTPRVTRCRGSWGCARPHMWTRSTPMGRRKLGRLCPKSDQHALSWHARELWKRDADETTSLLKPTPPPCTRFAAGSKTDIDGGT